MIEKTRTSRESRVKESRKKYYVVMNNGAAVGVSSNPEKAILFLEDYARKCMADRIADNIFTYKTTFATHFLHIQEVTRIK